VSTPRDKAAARAAGEVALSLEPIGYVRAPQASKAEAARQPAAASGTRGRIELLAGRNFEHALEDLEGWEYIWVIFHFHLNRGWRPKVLPPRSSTGRKGVFATRSPHRPNALGLSAVRLERIDGLTLHLGAHDMLDGTPVLDIKPYVAYTDAHPAARNGWLEDAANMPGAITSIAPADPIPRYEVVMEPMAARQAEWIESRTGLAIGERIRATLALGPKPHPYRRIRRDGDALRLAVKEWRVRFTVVGRAVRVMEIFSGYRAAQRDAAQGDAPPLQAHREFVARYCAGGSADA
jgi:tRNA-Thr(GGU) m(6)t(6)A37 methyltransferase TsaA